jgi:hypothetical protein
MEITQRQSGAQDGRVASPILHIAPGWSTGVVPMSQDDNGFRWRSPSGWHDNAMRRDAGHDAMQLAVLDYLQDLDFLQNQYDLSRESRFHYTRSTQMEYPLVVRGKPVAFADIITIHNKYADNKLVLSSYEIYEIKPIIHSIGAIIRQCTALELVGEQTLADPCSREGARVAVNLVVKSTDPKLAALRQVYEPWTWTGGDLYRPDELYAPGEEP